METEQKLILGAWLPDSAKNYAECGLKANSRWEDEEKKRFWRIFCNPAVKNFWQECANLSSKEPFCWDLAMLLFSGIPATWRRVRPLERKFTKAADDKRSDKPIRRIVDTAQKLRELIEDHPFVRGFFIQFEEYKGLPEQLERFQKEFAQWSPPRVRQYNAIFQHAVQIRKSASENAYAMYYEQQLFHFFVHETGQPRHKLIADIVSAVLNDDAINEENVKQNTRHVNRVTEKSSQDLAKNCQ